MHDDRCRTGAIQSIRNRGFQNILYTLYVATYVGRMKAAILSRESLLTGWQADLANYVATYLRATFLELLKFNGKL